MPLVFLAVVFLLPFHIGGDCQAFFINLHTKLRLYLVLSVRFPLVVVEEVVGGRERERERERDGRARLLLKYYYWQNRVFYRGADSFLK